MLTKLFSKPQWQHKDPEVRKQALAELSTEELEAALPELARTDPAPEVRLEAVERLRSLEALRSIHREDGDAAVRNGASKRLRDLLTGNAEDSPSLRERLKALNDLDDTALSEYLARYAPDQEVRDAALQHVQRQRVLGEIACHDESLELRLKALERINQESVLDRVVRETRKKDKHASRKAQQMLDEIRLERGDEKTLRKARVALCREAEAIVWKTGPAESSRSLEEITAQWKLLPSSPPDPELEHRFERICQAGGESRDQQSPPDSPSEQPQPSEQTDEEAKAAAEQDVGPAGQAVEQAAPQQAAEDSAAPAEAEPEAAQAPPQAINAAAAQSEMGLGERKAVLCQWMEEQLDQLHSCERIAKARKRDAKNRLKEAWLTWKKLDPVEGEQLEQGLQQRFQLLRRKLSERLDELPVETDLSDLSALCDRVEQRFAEPPILEEKQLRRFQKSWSRICRGLEKVPEAEKVRFDKALAQLKERFEKQAQELEPELEKIRQELKEAGELLDSGELLSARARHRQASQHLKRLAGLSFKQRKRMRKRLGEVFFRLRELKDWQHWSNNQVRIRLCEQVEGLLELKLPPEELDRQIRAARAEWMKLEKSEKLPTDSPHHASGPRLWRRFHAACNRAYEPCKEYFKQLAEKRQAKHQELVGVCERMEAWLKEDQPDEDWKPIESLIRQGGRSLRELNNIIPKQRGPMARRLRANLNRLEKRRKGIQRENEKKKQELIDRTRELVEEENLDQAAQQVRELQKAWREVGTTVRAREQALWQQFRAACGEVMNQRYQKHSEETQLQQDQFRQLAGLCRQVEKLCERSGDSLNSAEEEFQAIAKEWKEAAVEDSRLQSRYSRACRRFEQRMRAQRHQQAKALRREQAQARIEAFQQKAALCSQIEQAVGQDPDQSQTQIEAARKRWDELAELDRSTEKALQGRFEAACKSLLDGPGEDRKEQEKESLQAADLLCVRLEVLAGLDSPPESAKTRRQYQVSRLSAALSEREAPPNPQVEFEDIQRSFFLTGPLPADACKPLEQRFEKAMQAFLDKRAS